MNAISVSWSRPVRRSAPTISPTARSTSSSDRYCCTRNASTVDRGTAGSERIHTGLSDMSRSSKLGGSNRGNATAASRSPGAGTAGACGAYGATYANSGPRVSSMNETARAATTPVE